MTLKVGLKSSSRGNECYWWCGYGILESQELMFPDIIEYGVAMVALLGVIEYVAGESFRKLMFPFLLYEG